MMIRKISTYSNRSESKKFCLICGRNGHEDEACAAIPVTFTWKHGGNNISLCGSFSQWQVKRALVKDPTTGYFKLEIGLAPGIYQYKYLVDDAWTHDPDVPAIRDKENKLNNTVEVLPADFEHGESDADDEDVELDDYLVLIEGNQSVTCQPCADHLENHDSAKKALYKVKRIHYDFPSLWVSIKGSWDDWKSEIALKKYRNNFTGMYEFYVLLKLLPGEYHFKYLVDGEWVVNPTIPTVQSERGHQNNILSVPGACSGNLSCPKMAEKTCLNWRREDGKWNEWNAIHHTLQGHTMSVICDKVYIFGGLANGKFSNQLVVYDHKAGMFDLVDDQSGDIP